MFIPFLGAAKFLRERNQRSVATVEVVCTLIYSITAYVIIQVHLQPEVPAKSLWKRPFDVIFILYFIASIGVTLLRGFVGDTMID
jgi:hypothetical protein